MRLRRVARLAITGLLAACGEPAQPSAPDAQPCVTYCTLARLYCSNEPILYTSWDACTDACGNFPTTGQDGDTRGNTLQCRMTWIQVANQSPYPFCDDAGPQGGNNCV